MQPSRCSGVFLMGIAVATVVLVSACSTEGVRKSEVESRLALLGNQLDTQRAEIQSLDDKLTALKRELKSVKAEKAAVLRKLRRVDKPKPATPPPRADDEASDAAPDVAEAKPAVAPAALKAPPARANGNLRRAETEGDADADDEGETVADSSQEGLQLYFQALDRIEHRQYDEALKSLRAFLDTNPDHVYADRAQYLIVKSHFLNKDYGLVVVSANLLESHYPHSFKVPDALYERALASERMGQQEQARLALTELLKRFPNHPLAVPSAQALAAWTGHTGAIPLLDDIH